MCSRLVAALGVELQSLMRQDALFQEEGLGQEIEISSFSPISPIISFNRCGLICLQLYTTLHPSLVT